MKRTATFYLATLAISMFLFMSCGGETKHSSQSGKATSAEAAKKASPAKAKLKPAPPGQKTEDIRYSAVEKGKFVISDDAVLQMARESAKDYCACYKANPKDFESCRQLSFKADINMRKYESDSQQLWKNIFRKGIDNCPK